MFGVENEKEVLAWVADMHRREESTVLLDALIRAGLDLDVEVAERAIFLLPKHAVDLLIMHQSHVNVEAATQEFSNGDVFLPLTKRG